MVRPPLTGLTLYDIPQQPAAEFIELFDNHCRPLGYRARLRAFDRQVPHRERARRAIADGRPDFLLHGVPVVAVGGVCPGRPLPVVARATDEDQWADIRARQGSYG